MAKYDHFHEGGKVGRSNATPIKKNSVYSYDLKSRSFKSGNYIFITFEMLRVAYIMLVGKINISLLFRPSVIGGPWVMAQYNQLNEDKYFLISTTYVKLPHN